VASWSWPVSPVYITSPFDLRRVHPVTHVVTPHVGADFRAPTGTPLYAVHDGTVVASYWDTTGAGNYVRVDLGGGVWAGYHHLSKRLVVKGQRVTRGQVIGHAGSTGSATAAHLHFEIAVAGTRVDPVPFLAARTGASLVANTGLILGPIKVAPDGSLPDPLTPEDTVSAQDVIDALRSAEGKKALGEALLTRDAYYQLRNPLTDEVTPLLDAVRSTWDYAIKAFLRAAQGGDVDEKALAAALAPMLTGPLVAALEAAHVPSAQDVADAVVADLGAAITKGAAG